MGACLGKCEAVHRLLVIQIILVLAWHCCIIASSSCKWWMWPSDIAHLVSC